MDGNTFRPAQGAELTFLAESESAKSSHFIVLDDFGDGWNHTIKLDKFTDLPSDIEILFDRHKTSLPLLDRRHRLAGHPGEGLFALLHKRDRTKGALVHMDGFFAPRRNAGVTHAVRLVALP
jgi:hypothetical protein